MQRSPFTCAEDAGADQTRELVTKVLKPKTRDPQGPLHTVTLQKEASPHEKLHREAGPGNVPLLARSLDHREGCQGPWSGQVASLGAFLLLDPTNISLSRFPPTQTRALEDIQTFTHLPEQKAPRGLDQ